MTHLDGNIVHGDVPGLKLADELLALQIDDNPYLTFQKKPLSTESKTVGIVKSYCQQINSLRFNKHLVINKLEEIIKYVNEIIDSLEVTASKLNMLKIYTLDPINSNIDYQPELTWQSYSIVQQVYNLFSPHETQNNHLRSLLSLTKSFADSMRSFESRTKKDQFLKGNQRCQLSHTDSDYVLKCKQMLFTNIDRIYLTPIPFVMEHTLFQLIYNVYDYSDDYCITYGNSGIAQKQFRVYLEQQCCDEVFNGLVPRNCPLVQLRSKAMLIDTGEYEILVPNTDGSSMTAHCQGEIKHEPIYKNGKIMTDCALNFDDIKIPMSGADFVKVMVKELNYWSEVLNDREWSLLILAITLICTCIIQCCICYFRYIRSRNKGEIVATCPDPDESGSEEEAEDRTREVVATKAIERILTRQLRQT